MAVEDNKDILDNSTAGTSVNNSSKKGERSLGTHHSNYIYKTS